MKFPKPLVALIYPPHTVEITGSHIEQTLHTASTRH